MTTTFELGISSADAVTLYPEWAYSFGEKQVRSEYRTKSGRLDIYKWYDYKKIKIPLNWVTGSDMAVVNSWWDSNTKLLFLITSDSVTEVHSVMIMNDETPLAQFNRPYNDYYRGTIELEEY